MTDMLEDLHKQLHAAGVIEPIWHRRNHAGYVLLSYTSHLVALYTSGNYEAMPIFVGRVQEFLGTAPAQQLSNTYLEIVRRYVVAVCAFLMRRSDVSEAAKQFLPAHLRHAN